VELAVAAASAIGPLFFCIIIILGGMRQPIVPAPDDGGCGAICGMKIGKGN
jgi:hypothetical protein